MAPFHLSLNTRKHVAEVHLQNHEACVNSRYINRDCREFNSPQFYVGRQTLTKLIIQRGAGQSSALLFSAHLCKCAGTTCRQNVGQSFSTICRVICGRASAWMCVSPATASSRCCCCARGEMQCSLSDVSTKNLLRGSRCAVNGGQ